jgi:hypothetical protein
MHIKITLTQEETKHKCIYILCVTCTYDVFYLILGDRICCGAPPPPFSPTEKREREKEGEGERMNTVRSTLRHREMQGKPILPDSHRTQNRDWDLNVASLPAMSTEPITICLCCFSSPCVIIGGTCFNQHFFLKYIDFIDPFEET